MSLSSISFIGVAIAPPARRLTKIYDVQSVPAPWISHPQRMFRRGIGAGLRSGVCSWTECDVTIRPPSHLIICRAAARRETRHRHHGKICRHCVNGISINADLVIAPALSNQRRQRRPVRWIRCSMACAPSATACVKMNGLARTPNCAAFFAVSCAPRSSECRAIPISKPFCANNNAHALPPRI